MTHATSSFDMARLDALMTSLRLWFIGFLDAFADILGDGALARAWRRWMRAELEEARLRLRIAITIMALRRHRVRRTARGRERPRSVPPGFRRAREGTSNLRALTHATFRWKGRCVRTRIAQVWDWLADPEAAAIRLRKRHALGRVWPGLCAVRPPAARCAARAAPDPAAADTS